MPQGSRGPFGARVAHVTLAFGAVLHAVTACRTVVEPGHQGQVVVSSAPKEPRAVLPTDRALAQWDDLASAPVRPVGLDAAARALAEGDVDQALSALDLAMEEEPANALYCVARGELQVALGFLRAAEADFEHAIELDPENPRTWSALGRTRLALGLYMRASRALERAIDLGLDDARHHVLLARAYGGCDRAQDASAQLLAALRCVRSWGSGELWIAILGLSCARPGDVLPVSVFAHPLELVGAALALSPDWKPLDPEPDPLPPFERALRWSAR